MQVYNSMMEVRVSSNKHGERVFLITAKTAVEAVRGVRILMAPWCDDADLTVHVSKCPISYFCVVTDLAADGEMS